MHAETFNPVTVTPAQAEKHKRLSAAAWAYLDAIEADVPEGPDRTFILRNHRTTALWAAEAVMKLPDGTPRTDPVLGSTSRVGKT
jgi:hypothetical protein